MAVVKVWSTYRMVWECHYQQCERGSLHWRTHYGRYHVVVAEADEHLTEAHQKSSAHLSPTEVGQFRNRHDVIAADLEPAAA